MITKDMTIGEVIKISDSKADILMSFGMGCVGCPSAQAEWNKFRRIIRSFKQIEKILEPIIVGSF